MPFKNLYIYVFVWILGKCDKDNRSLRAYYCMLVNVFITYQNRSYLSASAYGNQARGTWQDAMNSSLHLHHCEKYEEYILSGGVYRLVIF